MAIDSLIASRRALLTLLKNDPVVLAAVDKPQIHPQTVAANAVWPFIRCGAPSGIPIAGTCLDGQEIRVDVHAFAKPRMLAGNVVETAEDYAGRLGGLIATSLDRRKAAIPGGRMTVAVIGSSLLRDGDEADAFHAIVNLRIRCMTA